MDRRTSRTSRLVLTACLAALLAAAAPASAQWLFGIGFSGPDGLSTLFTIDVATGAATPVGPVGFQRCGAMAFDPAGVLYATCERDDGSDTPVLITIDWSTGTGTEVGPTGLTGSIGDLSFDSIGTLFAYDASNTPNHTLHTIDPTTGASTLVGDTGLNFAGGNGMSFDLSGTLFHSQFTAGPNPDLNTLDPATGAPTFVSQLPPVTGRFNAMDVDPLSGDLYGVLNEGSMGTGPVSLATIDPVGGTATVVGLTESTLDAIAFAPPAVDAMELAIPTLGQLGLVLLAAVLALAGTLVLRRG